MKVGDLVSYFGISVVERRGIIIDVNPKYKFVQFPNGDLLLLNEEGKLMGLPLNPEATALWRKHFTKETHAFGYDDYVVGPAIVIEKNALNTWAN